MLETNVSEAVAITSHLLRPEACSAVEIVELEDFLCADADVIVHAEFSEDAVVDSMCTEKESDDEEEDEDGENQE